MASVRSVNNAKGSIKRILITSIFKNKGEKTLFKFIKPLPMKFSSDFKFSAAGKDPYFGRSSTVSIAKPIKSLHL